MNAITVEVTLDVVFLLIDIYRFVLKYNHIFTLYLRLYVHFFIYCTYLSESFHNICLQLNLFNRIYVYVSLSSIFNYLKEHFHFVDFQSCKFEMFLLLLPHFHHTFLSLFSPFSSYFDCFSCSFMSHVPHTHTHTHDTRNTELYITAAGSLYLWGATSWGLRWG